MAFKKGMTPWNKGKKCPQISLSKLGKLRPDMVGNNYAKGKAWNKGLKGEEYKKHYPNGLNGFKKGDKVNLGRKHSEEIRRKNSETKKKAWQNKEYKEKMSKALTGRKFPKKWYKNLRLATIRRIEICKNNGQPIVPTTGKYETQILDTLEKNFNYEIFRQYKVAGYFLDGYCPALNLAIEIDEPRHKNLVEKDKVREENIKQELSCKFLRIKVGGD